MKRFPAIHIARQNESLPCQIQLSFLYEAAKDRVLKAPAPPAPPAPEWVPWVPSAPVGPQARLNQFEPRHLLEACGDTGNLGAPTFLLVLSKVTNPGSKSSRKGLQWFINFPTNKSDFGGRPSPFSGTQLLTLLWRCFEWVQVTDKWVSRARNGKLAVIMAHKAYFMARSLLHDGCQAKSAQH